LPTPVFFYGLPLGETVAVQIPRDLAPAELDTTTSANDDDDVVVKLTLKRVGPLKKGRMRTVIIDVDGVEQAVEVKNPAAEGEFDGPMADPANPAHVPSPMPGAVDKVLVDVGQTVAAGDDLFVVSALKMEVKVKAQTDGRLASLAVNVRDKVVQGALLATILP